jgi:hypothetical protein
MRYIYFCYCLMLTNNNKTIVLYYFNSREKVRFEIQNVAYYWYFFFYRFRVSVIIPPLYEWELYCNHLVHPSVHTFVTDISASTGRNDFIFDIWLWHGDLYHVSPFQVYRSSTCCLQCDLEFFMFALMKTFVTVISASTGRNDFIFDIWLWYGDLYRVSPFQAYHTSTSCLQCDLEFLLVEKTGVPRENHRPVASYRQTLSHNVVLSTPYLSRIRTHNASGDRH